MQALLQTFDAQFLLFMSKVALAMLLGLALGLERVYAHKTAGMRTYALVSMSAALFILIAQNFVGEASGLGTDAVMRMASQIVVGIGFLGTGLIIFRDGHVENLTTAAGMWTCAGIGMAVGFGMFREAIFATVLTFFVLGILSVAERSIRLKYFPDPAFEKAEGIAKPKRVRAKKVAAE